MAYSYVINLMKHLYIIIFTCFLFTIGAFAQEQETDTAEIATKTLPESKEKTILGKPQTEQQPQTESEPATAPKVQPVKEPHSSIMDSFLKEAAQ